jgi:hypothetical protein
MSSPRVNWAEVVATVVGTGVPPEPSLSDISRVMVDPVMVSLEQRHVSQITTLREEYKTRHECLSQRIKKFNQEAIQIFITRYQKKIDEVHAHRKNILRIKELSLTAIRLGRVEFQKKRLEEINAKRLAKLQRDMPLSDMAEIIGTLDVEVRKQLAALEKELKIRDDEVIEKLSRSMHIGSYLEHYKKEHFITRQLHDEKCLVDELKASEEAMVTLIETLDLKFRAKLAVRLTGEPAPTVIERERLIQLHEQEKDRVRDKKDEFIVAYESYVSHSNKILDEINGICVNCFNYTDSVGHYYTTCFPDLFGCSALGCDDVSV